MSKVLYVTLFLTALFTASNAQAGWVQVWNDEFDGPSIDTSKWNFDIGTGGNGWGNNELEYYTDSNTNAFIRDGNLVISAFRQDMEGAQYTSARMHTAGKYQVLYGKFEMSAKLPDGSGCWPAFWLLGANIGTVGWPACGEIDIMETVPGTDPTNTHASTHQPGADTSASFNYPPGFKNDYHVYGVNWQPKQIDFYFDGQLITSVTSDHTNGVWIFGQTPMFILLNLAVGGAWPGPPNGNAVWPQQFIIDWVRVSEAVW